MTSFRSTTWVPRYFAHEASWLQFLFKGALVLIFAQQIYYPQPNKYLHLALVFVYMVFRDLLSPVATSGKNDYLLLASAMACSLLTVADHLLPSNLEAAYLAMLIVEALLTVALLHRLISVFRDPDGLDSIAEHHRAHAGKRPGFMKGMLWGMVTCLLFAVFYILYLLQLT